MQDACQSGVSGALQMCVGLLAALIDHVLADLHLQETQCPDFRNYLLQGPRSPLFLRWDGIVKQSLALTLGSLCFHVSVPFEYEPEVKEMLCKTKHLCMTIKIQTLRGGSPSS